MNSFIGLGRPWTQYQSQVVNDNQKVMINILDNALSNLGEDDPTWSYHRYNVFGLTSPTQVFYDLYNELRGFVYDYTNAEYLWIQSWVNYHKQDQVLKRHNHGWPIHGYISISPHNTETVFDNYKIQNEVGKVYIGPGNNPHHVEVLEPFDTPRITLGFDITDRPSKVNANLGMIPFPK